MNIEPEMQGKTAAEIAAEVMEDPNNPDSKYVLKPYIDENSEDNADGE